MASGRRTALTVDPFKLTFPAAGRQQRDGGNTHRDRANRGGGAARTLPRSLDEPQCRMPSDEGGLPERGVTVNLLHSRDTPAIVP
jgi:hypothetical protein